MSAPGDSAATISRRSWPYELEDKTLSIVGAGNIGKKVARLTQAFHMRVRYYDVDRLGGDAEDALGARFALFPELLKISDIVSLHVPLDTRPQTDGGGELGLMKPMPILINTCRAPWSTRTRSMMLR